MAHVAAVSVPAQESPIIRIKRRLHFLGFSGLTLKLGNGKGPPGHVPKDGTPYPSPWPKL